MVAQVSGLVEDKSVLMRNISSLYMTARLEIQRKEVEIKELRERCCMSLTFQACM